MKHLLKLLLICFLIGTFSSFSYAQKSNFLEPVNSEMANLSLSTNQNIEKLNSSSIYKELTLVEIGNLKELQKEGLLPLKLPGRKITLYAKTTNIEYFDEKNYTWTGEFNDASDYAIIIAEKGQIFGSFKVGNDVYELQYLEKNMGIFIEFNKEALVGGTCGTNLLSDIKEISEKSTIEEKHDGNRVNNQANNTVTSFPTVRVLFVHTVNARNAVANINNVASLAIAQANTVLNNSAIGSSQLRFSNAGVVQVNLTESNRIEDDLENLTLDLNIQNLRNTFEADLVIMLTNGTTGNYFGPQSSNGALGVAYVGFGAGLDEAFGYGIVQAFTATSRLTFAHEVGHLMGSYHQRCSVNLTGGCSLRTTENHGYGFKTGIWPFRKERTTIMHEILSGWEVQLHYSNPDVEIRNKDTGVNGSAYNARIFRQNAPIIAAYRDFTPPLTVSISGPSLAATGESLFFTSQRNNGTAPFTYQWRVSNDGFNYSSSGNASTFNSVMPGSQNFYIQLTVRDANLNTVTATKLVYNRLILEPFVSALS